MCLSVPAEITEIDGNQAVVKVGGVEYKTSVHMIDKPRVGDYVLVHAGFAIQKVSSEDARETLKLIKEMNDMESES